MDTTIRSRIGNSIFGLIDRVRDEARNFVHKEVELVKAEMSEKLTRLAHHAVYAAIGALTAYAALIFVLLSLSFLLASWFETLGLSTGISLFLGFLALAVVVGITGAIILVKALAAFSKESMAPEKTIQTLVPGKNGGPGHILPEPLPPAREPVENRNSDQIAMDVEKTRNRIHQDVSKIREQLTLAHLTKNMVNQVKTHPFRSVGIGLGTGLAGWLFVRRGAHSLGHKRTP